MTTTIGSLDLGALSDLREDVTQYFWFESNSSSAWGSGAHVTLYPESQFTDSNNANYLKGQNILMNTDGFSIRNGVLPMMVLDNDSLDFNVIDTTNNEYTNQASFGAVSTIGQTDGTQSYIQLDFRSLQMIDKEGDTYFYVSDLRGVDGQYLVTGLTFIGTGGNTRFNLNLPSIDTNYTVTVSDSSGGNVTKNTAYVLFSSAPTRGAIITIGDYYTTSNEAKAYTFGNRSDNNLGAMSYAIGVNNKASGYISYAEGYNTTASGNYSHAEGGNTTASGNWSHAECGRTTASGFYSHAEGYHTTASGEDSHAENTSTTASGNSSHAEGGYTNAIGEYSHAEGLYTNAEGRRSHAEGDHTTASGEGSHAEGYYTEAFNGASHAEGYYTTANGSGAHAGGTYSNAMGDSFAHGYHVSAPSTNSFVIGSYNIEDNSGGMASAGEYLFTIGNGTSENNRSNALTVAWDSTVAFADPSKTFVVTTETFSYPAISNGSASGARTATFSKTGYFPIGVVGIRTGTSAAVPTRFNLSSRSSGSATFTYVLRAVSAVSAGSGDVDILWIKIA